MKNCLIPHRSKMAVVLGLVSVCLTASLHATVVTWNLNPSSTEGAVGSTTQSFTSSGYTIAAAGYTVGFPSTPLGLYYKNGGGDAVGLGVTSTSDHELQGNGFYPAQFIQLNIGSLVSQGFTDAKIEVGSVGAGDTFVLWGSTSLTDPGHQIGGLYTSSSDLQFIDIGDLSSYAYISIGAITGGVLATVFQATYSYVPEMSALFPILGLIVAISVTQLLRRRRGAQAQINPR